MKGAPSRTGHLRPVWKDDSGDPNRLNVGNGQSPPEDSTGVHHYNPPPPQLKINAKQEGEGKKPKRRGGFFVVVFVGGVYFFPNPKCERMISLFA